MLDNQAWREEYHPGKTDDEIIKTMLKAEVSEYNDYLTGEVWGWRVKLNGVVEESCFGYYGDDGKEEADREAERVAEYEKKAVIVDQIFKVAGEQVAAVERDSKMDEVFKIASANTGLDVNTLKGAVNALKEASAKIGGPNL